MEDSWVRNRGSFGGTWGNFFEAGTADVQLLGAVETS